jgi:coenzyme F420-reducing hydrogenase delta subunit/predicted XRE-type DNA-binding protein
MSGVTRQSYTPEIRIVRLMCTGRVDLAFVLRAFVKGADGVLIGGCWPGECHYVTEGNYDALGNMHLARKLLRHVGIQPERVRIEWIAASEGMRFAEVMNDFSAKLKELGPLGKGEGIEPGDLAVRLAAVDKLIPYIKLVERERLRVPVKSEAAYQAFYDSDEAERLFDELIGQKLTVSQILALLAQRPLSTAQISEALGLEPSEVSRHMRQTSRQGLVRFDVERKCYALA